MARAYHYTKLENFQEIKENKSPLRATSPLIPYEIAKYIDLMVPDDRSFVLPSGFSRT